MTVVVFLTGGTGFIGAQVARPLVRQPDLRLVVLVRGGSQEEAVLRLKRAWWDWSELMKAIGGSVKVLRGDLVQPFLGLSIADYSWLTENISHIIHCAADTTPNFALEKLREINVQGTANVIELAKAAQQHHRFSRLSFVSTAYVAGKRRDTISETDLSSEFGFSSLYEQTKYESEQLINVAKNELPITVFRPSLVIGDSETGEIKTFNTIYHLLKLYLTGHLRVVPASSKLDLNIVPVNYVADAIATLTFNQAAAGLTLHLTAPKHKAPTAAELVDAVQRWAAQNMGIHLPKVRFVPVATRVFQGSLKLQNALKPSDKNINAMQTLAPYFSQNQIFSRQNTDRLLGTYSPDWRRYLPNLLQYAVYHSFFHRSERTVHEQILYRLESKNKPVRYHEINEDKVVDFKTDEVRREILQITVALKDLGVGRGDVVAVLGNNCLRYLMLDVATGLIGAISCPISVTTPLSEINRMLSETNAKVFFIGAPQVLNDIDAITQDIRVVNFNPTSHSETQGRVVSWENFLAKADAKVAHTFSPIDFQDIATIRYTYGSTGTPKGACLQHSNLRYVAEALASNFPWKTRTTKASYLSFLPMNHVAEGITATYSPYYIPTTLDVYFLADYRNLKKALLIAKPSVIFSIPRFYEKLWTTITESSLGQKYLATEEGMTKQILRKILRSAVLRKAGLNKCSQFIVGAACSSEVLLRNFENLGIEIHNAYGLSEAPLVAINKLGANTVDTVGFPLAHTQLHIDGDGEVLIKGPQVMRGYLNRGSLQPFRDDWFATGDIGELTKEGRLRILGRKKNIVVTSYGKKVPIERIEASFKGLPFVKECLVVGDDKPFCSIIFWVTEKKDEYTPLIEAAIEKVNLELEHPVQIKRYALVMGDHFLPQASAEMLKTKRSELLKAAEKVIPSIYNMD